MFSVPDLIWRKRQGETHQAREIQQLIKGYVSGAIPDYQVAAWLMAVYFRGLDPDETLALTEALVQSGQVMDLSQVPGVKVDKHSTGGVGDKTTLVVVPIARACGATVVKLAGRALGHTGGTLDKLESIPGMRVNLTPGEIIAQARRTGMVLTGHTADLVPADKRLYALRDVTATADCSPLIAASIMSKKIAGGAEAIVLDVKVGEGGFLSRLEEARDLARTMVELGRRAGRSTVAVLSHMDEPLGWAVGNSLEVLEAVDTLKGGGPADLRELCLTLSAHVVHLAGKADSWEQARVLCQQALEGGQAWSMFRELVVSQGGDPAALDGGLPAALHRIPVVAASSGFVQSIAARRIGDAVARLGGGRQAMSQNVEHGVGVVLTRKTGDRVEAGDQLGLLHARELQEGKALAAELASAWSLGNNPPVSCPLVYEVLA